MGLFQELERDYHLLTKSRTSKSALYPERFFVAEEWIDWNKHYSDYAPVEFTAPVVLNPKTEWADPEDIQKIKHQFKSFHGEVKTDRDGRPLNPFGRTGITGRGLLGKWGANFAVDGLITAFNHNKTELYFLAIKRSDTGEMATPGGYIENDDDIWSTRNREMLEEVSVDMTALSNVIIESVVDQGYIDDPRCTDNAWIETSVIHTHIATEVKEKLYVKAGDDAAGFEWMVVTAANLKRLYANHALNVLKGVRQLILAKDVEKNDLWVKHMNRFFNGEKESP